MGLFGKSKKEKEQEYMSKINVDACLKENFELIIDDVFTIIGVGTLVTGTVNAGMCLQNRTCRNSFAWSIKRTTTKRRKSSNTKCKLGRLS